MALGPGACVPMPFDLPPVSRGFAEVTRAARALGMEVAEAAARSLSELLGREVVVAARALPGASRTRSPVARIALDLPALPARAAIEVEPALVVRLVGILAGAPEDGVAATALTPVEAAALDLFALCAIEGACSIAAVEGALSPRLDRGSVEVPSPLGVELDISVAPSAAADPSPPRSARGKGEGDRRRETVGGRARLLLPASAVRAFRGSPGDDGPAAAMPLPASLRNGTARITSDELDALVAGDVVVLDSLAEGRAVVVLPGGLRASGRIEGDAFHVEETTMTERRAELPIELEIELARFPISLGELARLESGTVLPVPVDRRGLVVLRAGERAVARGELVDVEGAIGVRVLSVEVAP
jgi:type III secretion system YscQ/HrcQ family protein